MKVSRSDPFSFSAFSVRVMEMFYPPFFKGGLLGLNPVTVGEPWHTLNASPAHCRTLANGRGCLPITSPPTLPTKLQLPLKK